MEKHGKILLKIILRFNLKSDAKAQLKIQTTQFKENYKKRKMEAS